MNSRECQIMSSKLNDDPSKNAIMRQIYVKK